MKFKFLKHEEMLLSLLKAAINQQKVDSSVFEDVTADEWKACYQTAVEQGVMALAWDGILTLPSNLIPPKEIKLKWFFAVEAYEKRYSVYCQTISELDAFYAKNGISTLLLKGVGFSIYYPIPQHREGGDIDIYTFSADKDELTDLEANFLADKLMTKQHIDVDNYFEKHSIFYFHGIPIENHHAFLDVDKLSVAIPIENALKSCFNFERINLPLGKGNVLVPSVEFNRIFIAFHALQHYGVGLCLHHMCDWACLIKRDGFLFPKGVTENYFLKFMQTISGFANRYLGVNDKNSICEQCDEVALDKLLHELFRSPYRYKYQSNNPFAVIIHKTRHLLYYRRLIKDLTGEPIWKGVCESLLRILHTPKIFYTVKK